MAIKEKKILQEEMKISSYQTMKMQRRGEQFCYQTENTNAKQQRHQGVPAGNGDEIKFLNEGEITGQLFPLSQLAILTHKVNELLRAITCHFPASWRTIKSIQQAFIKHQIRL